MKRISVAAIMALLVTTMAWAEEAQRPPSAGELVVQIQKINKKIEGLQLEINKLVELRTRIQGAYQYAIMLQDAEKAATNMTCEDGSEGTGECSGQAGK